MSHSDLMRYVAMTPFQHRIEAILYRYKIPDENRSYRQGERDPSIINAIIRDVKELRGISCT